MLTALIADDEKKICQLLRVLVNWQELGYEIIGEAYDGLSLLEAAKSLDPDVIITDIQMPGLSGLEMLKEIRKQQMDIDIIIMSGYREFDYVKTALHDGAIDYLLKPLSKDALGEALTRVKERRTADQSNRKHMEQMQKTLQDHVVILKENLVRDVVEGRLINAGLAELNERYGLALENTSLIFGTVKLDTIDPVPENQYAGIYRKIRSIAEEEAKKHQIPIAVSSQQNFTYLLATCSDQEFLEEYLYHLIYAVKDYFCKWDTGHVTIGWAKVYEGRLREALERSRKAVFDQVFEGSDKLICWKEEAAVSAEDTGKQTEEFLRDALSRLADAEIRAYAEKSADNIIKEGSDKKSGIYIYQSLTEMLEKLRNICQNLYPHIDNRETFDNAVRRLNLCWSLNYYKKVFLQELDKILAEILSVQNEREKVPIRRIRQIIQERFRENLTLDDLADELGFSPTYVSKLIKKEMNVGFSQYLNMVRLEKSKQLLASTDKTAAEIAYEAGYRDEKYFLRIFRKEVGLTTSEYRRIHGE